MAIRQKTTPQNITKEKNKFLIFCIEIYKNKKRISGTEAAHIFFETKLAKYIEENFSVLHTLSTDYLLKEFNEILRAR